MITSIRNSTQVIWVTEMLHQRYPILDTSIIQSYIKPNAWLTCVEHWTKHCAIPLYQTAIPPPRMKLLLAFSKSQLGTRADWWHVVLVQLAELGLTWRQTLELVAHRGHAEEVELWIPPEVKAIGTKIPRNRFKSITSRRFSSLSKILYYFLFHHFSKSTVQIQFVINLMFLSCIVSQDHSGVKLQHLALLSSWIQ